MNTVEDELTDTMEHELIDTVTGDNTVDRKSSQGDTTILSGGAIGSQANKQDTVTTSEAELLSPVPNCKRGYIHKLAL